MRAGFTVRVYNRAVEKTAPLVTAGASLTRTPADAACGAGVVVSCLLDDVSLHAVAESDDGLLAGMAVDAIHVSTATVSPGCSERLAVLHQLRGQHFLAAPILGRPEVAQAGELLSLVGGPDPVFERARPVIEGYSARVLHTGTLVGTANSLKLAVNFYIASMAELFGQFLAFAETSEVEHETAMQMLRAMQGHPAVAGYLERVGGREFDEVGFAMTTGLKDLQLILDAATTVRCPLPFATIARDRTLSALATGLGDKDWSAFTEIARRSAGLM
jgi:3-hydroxyisobutyrate dehydrogenase-like beta-hydroxyacid dehydrogenase